MAQIIDGKQLARDIRKELKQRVLTYVAAGGAPPRLDVVLVGDDAASHTYVRAKERACSRCGITSHTHRLPADVTQHDLLQLVDGLNRDSAVHGFLVQLPLPAHLDPEDVVLAISPSKDVDAFHPENLGLLFRGRPRFAPCTPAGVVHMLDSLGIPLQGKHAVVIGRSLIVGKPLSFLLLERHMTVTICHSRTLDLADMARTADVLVAAVGKPGLVRGDWIKPGAVVIDVGTNMSPEGVLTGDVVFDEATKLASYVTPVPGGVGPLTVAMLLSNVCSAAFRTR